MFTFLPQIIMTLCIIAYASIYLVGIRKGTVKPVLATWLFLTLATVLSILTDYKESGISGLLSNAFNIIDTLAVTTIFIVILFRKDSRKTFNKFEKGCLYAVTIIFIAWIVTGQNVLAHLAIQAIMVIAYLPTLFHLWNATENTEALGTWVFDFTASVFGVIEPLKVMAFLPLVYGFRSIISTLAVIVLILRLKYKKKTTPF